MEPTVVTDPLSYAVKNNQDPTLNFGAGWALTNMDRLNNGRDSWLGWDGKAAYFVYDLGCKAKIRKLDRRLRFF